MALILQAPPTAAVLLAIILAALASFGYVVNDLWDRQVDLINSAGHLEHADHLTLLSAWIVAVTLVITALVLALLGGRIEMLTSVSIAVGLAGYTVIFRRLLVLATLLAALLGVAPLWMPLVIWPNRATTAHWLFVTAAATMMAAREIVMDVRDRFGDRAGGRSTLATAFGPRAAMASATILSVTGGAVLAAVLAIRFSVLDRLRMFGAVISVMLIFYEFIVPAVSALLMSNYEQNSIRGFVTSSRTAMCVMPFYVLVLWRY